VLSRRVSASVLGACPNPRWGQTLRSKVASCRPLLATLTSTLHARYASKQSAGTEPRRRRGACSKPRKAQTLLRSRTLLRKVRERSKVWALRGLEHSLCFAKCASARSGNLGSASAAKLLLRKRQTAGTAVPVTPQLPEQPFRLPPPPGGGGGAPHWFAEGEPVGGGARARFFVAKAIRGAHFATLTLLRSLCYAKCVRALCFAEQAPEQNRRFC